MEASLRAIDSAAPDSFVRAGSRSSNTNRQNLNIGLQNLGRLVDIIQAWGRVEFAGMAKDKDDPTNKPQRALEFWALAERAVVNGDAASLQDLLHKHPEMRDQDPPGYYADGPKPNYSEGDAQSIIAREHAVEDFDAFVALTRSRALSDSNACNFELAADALVAGELETLRDLLSGDAGLIHARSTRRHHATLLHYTAANGIEGFRQRTPENIVEITNFLLAGGAEVDALAVIYGQSTTLLLAATSVHPWRAGVQNDLMEILIQAGANFGAVPGDRNVVNAALRNGRKDAALFLAEHGAYFDMEGAAGLGRLDVVKKLMERSEDSGSSANQEVGEGLRCACEFGQISVVKFLLQKADATACDHALHSAIFSGNAEILQMLLERGPNLETRSRWNATALGTAAWCALQGQGNIDYRPMIATLIAAGAHRNADPGLEEEIEAILHPKV